MECKSIREINDVIYSLNLKKGAIYTDKQITLKILNKLFNNGKTLISCKEYADFRNSIAWSNFRRLVARVLMNNKNFILVERSSDKRFFKYEPHSE